MFDNKLQPIYDGRVLANQSAINDPVVQTVLKEMSLRNFEPQRINNYGFGTSQIGTNYERNQQTTPLHQRGIFINRTLQQI